jgi:outer membrane receptor protein involved in Fe transport
MKPANLNALIVRSAARALLAFTAALPICSAQSTPAPARPTESAGTEEVITIPEFQVTTSRERDAWFASTAMSGTRTAAPVIELPYQIQVLTQEFLEDFQLISLSEQMAFFTAYSGSADQSDAAIGATGSGKILRGFDQTIVRDGFRRAPPPTIANTAQVEVIKGPISTLYGDAAPGGLINYVSKRPSQRPNYSLSLSAGSYDFLRSNVLATGPLYKDKLFYLITADNYYRASSLQYVYARQGDYLATLLFKPTSSTSVSVTYELVRLHGARGATMPSLVVGTRPTTGNPLAWTGGVVQGYDRQLAAIGYSRFGPNEIYDRLYDGLNVTLEHAYNRDWKHRVAYQAQWKSFDQPNRTTSNVSAETGRMNNVRPNRRLQDIDGIAVQTDLLGNFRTGPLKHALLFTADFADDESYDSQWQLPTAQEALLPDWYRYPDPLNQDWTPLITDYSQLSRRASKTQENLKSRGGSVSDRISINDGAVILMGNVRYDKVEFEVDTNAAVNALTRGKDDAWTYAGGINVKLRGDALVAFANTSTSFNTNPTIDRGTGTTIANEEGRGLEVGFKSLAANGRLGFTLSGYHIEKRNIGQSNPDWVTGDIGTGFPEFLGNGKERVRGVDGDVNFKVSDAFTMMVGGSYLDAHVIASTNAALVDTRKINVPRVMTSIATRYKFGGRLQGASAGASFRYNGSYVRAQAAAARAYEEAGPRQIYGAFVGYNWRGRRFGHGVRVNAHNLSDKIYVGPDNNLSLGRQVNFTYTISFR